MSSGRDVSAGIVSWGTYLPAWRLQRSAIAGVLGGGAGRGTRSVASYDEDTTTLAVEAGRRALAGTEVGVNDVLLSTPDPAYLDKTSATTVHAALGLGRACGAYDLTGSPRSAIATLIGALRGSFGRARHVGRRLGSPDRARRLGRGARERGRRGGLPLRARGRRGPAGRAGGVQRRVPRPMARPG